MQKYEYKVQKLQIFNVEDSTEVLNGLGNEGFKLEFITAKDSHLIAVLSKERPGPGRPKKEEEE